MQSTYVTALRLGRARRQSSHMLGSHVSCSQDELVLDGNPRQVRNWSQRLSHLKNGIFALCLSSSASSVDGVSDSRRICVTQWL